MVQYEAMLVLNETDPETQFDRHARLALADPFGVRLKDRNDLLGMGALFRLEWKDS